ncbi:FkbM family methyltransferase [Thalassococcus sp. BH17M4-6]|uniref:FkbM family methyltransferase n=1 Tax=Thalassococcus sp. BH17M4-6 TaxID=3413148 RepID=UPI003BC20A8E
MVKEIIRSLARPPALALRALGVTPPEKVFRHLHKVGPFAIALPDGRGTLQLMSWGNRVENELFWRGWVGHEPDVMRWWGRLSLDARTVLDVGANTGSFAFIAKALTPQATVHAFEPLARIADRLRENQRVSGLSVEIFQAAVADQTGELPIHDPGGANAYSASLDPNFLAGDKESYMVPVTTIDAHCATHDLTPDLIKIDVEGLEGRLLLGARDTLAKGQAVIVCEWTRNSDAHEAARDLLLSCGYVSLDPATGQTVDLDMGREHAERNVLLCPKDRVDVLKATGPL